MLTISGHGLMPQADIICAVHAQAAQGGYWESTWVSPGPNPSPGSATNTSGFVHSPSLSCPQCIHLWNESIVKNHDGLPRQITLIQYEQFPSQTLSARAFGGVLSTWNHKHIHSFRLTVNWGLLVLMAPRRGSGGGRPFINYRKEKTWKDDNQTDSTEGMAGSRLLVLMILLTRVHSSVLRDDWNSPSSYHMWAVLLGSRSPIDSFS